MLINLYSVKDIILGKVGVTDIFVPTARKGMYEAILIRIVESKRKIKITLSHGGICRNRHIATHQQ